MCTKERFDLSHTTSNFPFKDEKKNKLLSNKIKK